MLLSILTITGENRLGKLSQKLCYSSKKNETAPILIGAINAQTSLTRVIPGQCRNTGAGIRSPEKNPLSCGFRKMRIAAPVTPVTGLQ